MSDSAVVVASARVVRAGGRVADPQQARNAHAVWPERRGLILLVRDRAGRVGVGEASPLPGHSPDTLAGCARALAALRFPAHAVTLADLPAVAGAVREPAARFAIETALLDLLGQAAGLSVAALLGRVAAASPVAPLAARPARAPLNALIADLEDMDGVLARVDAARARGIRCIKIKIGRPGRLDHELAVLCALRARHGHELVIRLDANRAWSEAEAARNLARLAELAPAYVEEPAADLAALAALAARPALPVPLALDESLIGLAPAALDALLGGGHVRALVLKPMCLGLLDGVALAARARARGALAVTSHLMDGPVALAAAAHLAAILGETAGLDRHAGLSAWPALPIPFLHDAHVDPPPGPGLGLGLPPAWLEARA